MALPPTSDWLSALKLPTQVMVGLFAGCGLILWLDSTGALALVALGDAAKPVTLIVFILSGCLSASGIAGFLFGEYRSFRKRALIDRRKSDRKLEHEESVRKAERQALNRIEHLAADELAYLAECLVKGEQSFTTYVHDPDVTNLMGKQLVYTVGGSHNQDYYPFIIHDFVWREILSNKEKLLAKHTENERKKAEDKRRGRY